MHNLKTEASRRSRIRRPPSSVPRTILFLAALALPSVTAAADLATERREVESLLRATIEEGHREEDVYKIVSAYAPGAEIVSHIFGRLSLEEFAVRLGEDFETLVVRKTFLEVLEFELEGESAMVLVNLSVSGDLPRSLRANRHDRLWLDLRKKDGRWRIHRQGYRRDFGVTEEPHDFSR